MNDEQDNESNGFLGWILGLAVFIAIAVSLLTALAAAFSGQPNTKAVAPTASASAAVTTGTAAMATVTAPTVSAGNTAISMAKPDLVKVYFDSGKAAAPADTDKALKALADYAMSSANAKLQISGFHDKTGDPAANAELAKNRAKAVVAALKAAGATEDRLMLLKPQEVLGGVDDKEARRVEISVAQ